MAHQPSLDRRQTSARWWAAGARSRAVVGMVLVAAGAAATTVGLGVFEPAQAREGTHESDQVIVCESGVISDGDVETASAFAVRAPSGTQVPDGCREGVGQG